MTEPEDRSDDIVESVLASTSAAERERLLGALLRRTRRESGDDFGAPAASFTDPAPHDAASDFAPDDADRRPLGDVTLVRRAIDRIPTAATPDEVADELAPVASALFGTDVAVLYRYDDADEAFVSVARTEAAEAAPGPVEADDGRPWSAFRGEEPAVLSADGPASLVLPVPGVGAIRIDDVAVPSITATSVELAALVAPVAVGVADLQRRLDERRDELEDVRAENEQLRDFANIVSHDLRNPLSVARGFLQLAVEEGDEEYVEKVEGAHDRIESIIKHTLALAQEGEQVGETVPTDVETVAHRAWSVVDTSDAALEIEASPTVDADPDRLQQLFENLFRNAIEHGSNEDGDVGDRSDADESAADESGAASAPDDADSPAVTVRVGAMDDGFYVEDDGPGIPPEDREQVFERGYSGNDGGTGLGLGVVEEIAAAHDWSIDLAESGAGGARFEIRT